VVIIIWCENYSPPHPEIRAPAPGTVFLGGTRGWVSMKNTIRVLLLLPGLGLGCFHFITTFSIQLLHWSIVHSLGLVMTHRAGGPLPDLPGGPARAFGHRAFRQHPALPGTASVIGYHIRTVPMSGVKLNPLQGPLK
jgi:hypothetical protein